MSARYAAMSYLPSLQTERPSRAPHAVGEQENERRVERSGLASGARKAEGPTTAGPSDARTGADTLPFPLC